MMVPSMRPALLKDLPRIVEIYNSTVSSRMVTADTEPVSVESRVEWFHKHGNTRPLWVVEVGDEVIGWIALHDFYGRPAYQATAEVSLYLDEKHRGKGMGNRLLEWTENEAKKLGVKTLLGYIFSHNAPSLQLFAKRGFTQWGMLPDIAELDGVERSLTILGKRIVIG
jgi:L-amino acid N-acyltransferase YncA